MSVEDILFSQKMLCPYCHKYLVNKMGLFYCKHCEKYFESHYLIKHLGDRHKINEIKLEETKE